MTRITNPLYGIILVLGWVCQTGNLRAESIASADRLTVAVLAFANQTDDREAAHWCHSLPRMPGSSLASVQAIRVYPAEACNYGLERMKLRPGNPLTAAQARQIGETIKARCVVWGEYRHHQKNWIITARLLQLENDKESADFSADAADWFDVCEKLAVQIVHELAITPSVFATCAKALEVAP